MVVVDQLVENVPNVLVGAVKELVLETPFGPALVPARKKPVPKSRPSRRQSRVTKVTKRNHQTNSLHRLLQQGFFLARSRMSIFVTFSAGK